MREKPVPMRVGKDKEKKKTLFSPVEMTENNDLSEENGYFDPSSNGLPSMVSVTTSKTPFVYEDSELYQTQAQILPQECERQREFEFLEKPHVSESQKQAVKFGVRVFQDWLTKQNGMKHLEEMSRQELANTLKQFYLTARRPNGTQYKKNTLKSIKHSLDLYLRASPLQKDYSISSDYDFRQVNMALDNLPEDADNNRFPRCTLETIIKLYRSGQLGLVSTDDPQILIQTVWFYIATYFFANIDKRMLRQITHDMLVLGKDKLTGLEYFWLNYTPPERCRSNENIRGKIYARQGSLCCPVEIIKKYLEHRNPKHEVLFQHPKTKPHDVIWYSTLPLGKNKHLDIIKAMCVNADIIPPLTGRCLKCYVQELLQQSDPIVNNLFQTNTITNMVNNVTLPHTLHGPMPEQDTSMKDHQPSEVMNGAVSTNMVVPYPVITSTFSTLSNLPPPVAPYNQLYSTTTTPMYGTFTVENGSGGPSGGPSGGDMVMLDTSTQTDNKETNPYKDADLKTKNRMRLQARQSLLSFLEDLNDISDGHASELFKEIVQEDINIWKSIAGNKF